MGACLGTLDHSHSPTHRHTITPSHYHLTHCLRYCGDIEACRKILQRAVNSAGDDPEGVCRALLEFEREVGSLETYEGAMERCAAQLRRVKGRREKVRSWVFVCGCGGMCLSLVSITDGHAL